MKNNSKRGFTIVELIIVIAVIGILAAVLIPTFSELIKQAQTANDTVLVTNLNKALALDPTATYDTMHKALTSVRENGGYDVAKINATNKDNEILWDSVNKCFVYKDGGEIKYIPDTQKTVIAKNEEYKFWQICNENNPIPEASAQTYSVYWSGSNRKDVTVSVGFDAGDAVVSVVNYNGATENSGRTVDIRTNGGTLNVNAKADTVNHYMSVDSVSITAVGTYNEYGKVTKAALEVESGKVEVKDGAFVNKIALPATETTSVEVNIATDTIVRSIEGGNNMVKSNPNNVVKVNEDDKTKVKEKVTKSIGDIGRIFNKLSLSGAVEGDGCEFGRDKDNNISSVTYSEKRYLEELQKKGTSDVDLYYTTEYAVSGSINSVEVDGVTYTSSDNTLKYGVGNSVFVKGAVYKIDNGKLCINKITYISALTRKQALKVNGKAISVKEDCYDVDATETLSVNTPVFTTGSDGYIKSISSNEYNVYFYAGQSVGRIGFSVKDLDPGDVAIICTETNGVVSQYSTDSYNNACSSHDKDFGTHLLGWNRDRKSSEPAVTRTETYIVFDKEGKFKGTFTIVFNCYVVENSLA